MSARSGAYRAVTKEDYRIVDVPAECAGCGACCQSMVFDTDSDGVEFFESTSSGNHRVVIEPVLISVESIKRRDRKDLERSRKVLAESVHIYPRSDLGKRIIKEGNGLVRISGLCSNLDEATNLCTRYDERPEVPCRSIERGDRVCLEALYRVQSLARKTIPEEDPSKDVDS